MAVEIEMADGKVDGRIRRAGAEPVEFRGWLQLIAALERMRARSRGGDGDGGGDRRRDGQART